MPLLAIQRPGAHVGLRGTALEVHHAGQHLLTRPLHTVDEVHLYGEVELSAPARFALLRQGTEVLLLSPTGRLLGRIAPPETRGALRRHAQHRALAQPEHALALARSVVAAKLTNQRAFVVRLLREQKVEPGAASETGGATPIDPGLAVGLARLDHRVAAETDLDRLRGLEGQGAALYFRALGQAVRIPVLGFSQRSRRPPRDPFNACLSFGYTLLGTRLEASLRRAGLDPGLGALHTPTAQRASLMLDVVEPYRVLIDRLVLGLINRRALNPDDFMHPAAEEEPLSEPLDPDATLDLPAPAVHLGPSGRPIFLRALGELWRTAFDHPERPGRFALDDLFDHHAQALGAWFEGERADPPPPFRLR